MIRIENHCCGCAVPGYPCRGSSCPSRAVEVHYCDRCDEEIYHIYTSKTNGDELCYECYEKEQEE